MNYTSFIEIFLDLVKIDSPSGNEYEFLNYIDILLTKLGFIIKYDKYNNLIAKNNFKLEKPSILFAFHSDKVSTKKEINPIIKNNYILSDGNNSIGADNKASLACLLWILINNKYDFPIEITLTRMEEEGFIGARNLDFSLISSKLGVMIDGGLIGEMVISSNYWTKILFKYDNDVNKIKSKIDKLKYSSINRSQLSNEKNDVYNLCIDLFSTISNIDQEIYNIIENTEIANYKILRKCPGYNIKDNEYIYEIIYHSIKQSNIEPKITNDLIGNEVCIYNSIGIKMINIGDGVIDCHEVSEKIKISDMEKTCEILSNLLVKYGANII